MKEIDIKPTRVPCYNYYFYFDSLGKFAKKYGCGETGQIGDIKYCEKGCNNRS